MTDQAVPLDRFWAVVPAGGAGTRLWPLSRAGSPKFLHDLAGTGQSLLQATASRVGPLVGERILVVTGRAHADAVRAQLPGVPADQIVAEPSARDSMAAIGLAAALIEQRDPDGIIGSFAADHVILDEAAFRACVETAVRAADAGELVTIGIDPDAPSTAFGYIEFGEALPSLDGAYRVSAFVEKPDQERAEQYLATGRYRWNAGMFVARAGVLLDLLAAQDPEFAGALRALAARGVDDDAWSALPKIAIDHAIAEPAAAAGRVAVVPGAFGWEDIGDFEALAGLLAAGSQPADGETVVLGDAAQVLSEQSTGLVVPGSGRMVAVLGLADIVVVDTPDAVLVTTTAKAQQVKALVDRLKAAERTDLV